MTITRTNKNQTIAPDGRIISEQIVEADVTAEVVTLDLHAKLRAFLTAARDAIAAQIVARDANTADITAALASRDAAQAVIDNPASTGAQKNAARTDREFALIRLDAARHAKQVAALALEMLRAQAALLRLVIGSDLLVENTDT